MPTSQGLAGIDVSDPSPVQALQMKVWAATQLIAPFLSSPENSEVCAATVYKILHRIIPTDSDAAETRFCIRLLRTDYRACLDALVHFVTVPRPESELQRIAVRLNQCRCDLTVETIKLLHDNDNDAHAPSDFSFNGVVEMIFSTLGCVVLNGLKVGHIVGAQSGDPTVHSKAKKWPPNTAALFPAGQEAAVVSFSRLYLLTKSSLILDYIRILLPHCPSIAIPLASNNLFWEAFVDGLQLAVQDLPGDPFISGADLADEYGKASTPTRAVMAVAMFISPFIATFTETLRQNITTSRIITHARKIYDLLIKAVLLADKSPRLKELPNFCFLASGMAIQVATSLPKSQRPLRIHPILIKHGKIQGPNSHMFTEVFAILGRVTSVAQCCNAACQETSESSAQKLRYCARCRVMRYCSSTCQKTAWKYHKVVCGDVEKLNKNVMPMFSDGKSKSGVPPAKRLEDFELEARKIGFTEERMKEISAELMPFLHFENAGMTAYALGRQKPTGQP